MALVVSGISLPFEEPWEEAERRALGLLGVSTSRRAFPVKRSVDARRKGDIRFVYSVGVELEGDEATLAVRLNHPRVTLCKEEPLDMRRGEGLLPHPPVVVGLGPAGLFAALLLARAGLRPVVLERGADVDRRARLVEGFWETGGLDPHSNVQFGEGGAGAFSDGKLTTRIGDGRTAFVLRELAAHGAPPDILYQAKPHVGTDLLREVVKAIRREILELGGEVRFHTCLEDIRVEGGAVRALSTSAGELAAEAVVLAPGHSARDTFAMLRRREIPLTGKPFSVGVRVEHLQGSVDRALYGDKAGHPLLPPGEYQLSHRREGRGVYTFCMCPGGVVVPAASGEGEVVTNGMSYHARDGRNANAALVVSVDGRDFGEEPLDGVAFQRRLEQAAFQAGGGGFAAPLQTVGRFLEERPGAELGAVRPTYARGWREGSLDDILPAPVTAMLREGLRAFGRKQRGFDAPDTLLTGVETRTSSPVRIPRGESMEADGVRGLYPCGEGAGYAGGIVSAAVDGLRCAQAILARYGGLRGKTEEKIGRKEIFRKHEIQG